MPNGLDDLTTSLPSQIVGDATPGTAGVWSNRVEPGVPTTTPAGARSAVNRLYPQPAVALTPHDAYGHAAMQSVSPAHNRPATALCMVSSLDGSVALGGASAGLSSPTDRAVLIGLRALADVILVGAGTVRDEGYGPPKKPGQRIGVVTRTGRCDLSLPLFTSGAGFLIMPHDGPATPAECVRAGHGEVNLLQALQQLPGSPSRVQIEGGAKLNGAFLAANLFDEVNLTLSPAFVGGDGPRVNVGAPEGLQAFTLAELYEQDSFLFARYVRRTTG
jgi:riboflavin biosynthesis pyrimidine reductase